MPISSYQIRVCQGCGLRYPITEHSSFGLRCPICLGETEQILINQIGNGFAKINTSTDNTKIIRAVLIDNIRSAWNVGSILRSADGFGFTHAYLCGITPTPENVAVAKTSLGSEDFVTWSHHNDAVKLVKGLKKEDWTIFALEEHPDAKPIEQAGKITKNTVLVVGGEVTGVDPDVITLADEIFYISMHGQKRSFNVAVAFGIAGFALSDQYRWDSS